MNESEVLSAAADSLLDKPYEFEVDRRPESRLEKWLIKKGLRPAKRKYLIKQLRYANVVRISKALIGIPAAAVLMKSDRTQRDIISLQANHGEALLRIAAICLTNPREEPSEELLERLNLEFEQHEILAICGIAVQKLHPQDFLSSIILIVGADVLNTSEEKVSQQVQRETIARGDSSNLPQGSLRGGL